MSKKLILVLFGQDILKIAEGNKLYKETWILNVTENGEHFLMHHHMEFYELKSFCLLQNISLCFYCYDFLLVHLFCCWIKILSLCASVTFAVVGGKLICYSL